MKEDWSKALIKLIKVCRFVYAVFLKAVSFSVTGPRGRYIGPLGELENPLRFFIFDVETCLDDLYKIHFQGSTGQLFHYWITTDNSVTVKFLAHLPPISPLFHPYFSHPQDGQLTDVKGVNPGPARNQGTDIAHPAHLDTSRYTYLEKQETNHNWQTVL